VQVAYDPDNDDSFSDWNSNWGDKATLATGDAGTFTLGAKSKRTTRLTLGAFPQRVRRGGTVILHGSLSHAAGATTVALYQRRLGGTAEKLLAAAVPVEAQEGSRGPTTYTFTFPLRHVRRSVVLKAVWSGDGGYLGATGSCKVRVTRR